MYTMFEIPGASPLAIVVTDRALWLVLGPLAALALCGLIRELAIAIRSRQRRTHEAPIVLAELDSPDKAFELDEDMLGSQSGKQAGVRASVSTGRLAASLLASSNGGDSRGLSDVAEITAGLDEESASEAQWDRLLNHVDPHDKTCIGHMARVSTLSARQRASVGKSLREAIASEGAPQR